MRLNMKDIKTEIKQGVTLHSIHTNKFKTNLFAVFLATPLNKETVTQNALIAAVLRRGTQNIKSQDLINQKLEEMYGAYFNCGIEKTGDNQIIKFYLETISDEFLPEKEELSKKCIEILMDIIFNPLIEENGFKKEYVKSEKNNLKQIIESKMDNKRAYSLERCIEEMFKEEPYGLYKFGYVEDIEKITPQSLYKQYKNLINKCKIDIFVSGTEEKQIVEQWLYKNNEIEKLEERKPDYIVNTEKNNLKEAIETKEIEEQMDVGQGNIVMGLNINSNNPKAKYITSLYNAILGGGANSKLFQNVREKESLAYTAGSTYKRQKNVIFIRCGIEISDYEKAVETIKQQLEQIKNGEFTEEDVENAKQLIIESIQGIEAEQDTEITYYYGQELSDTYVSLDEYINNIRSVTKQEIEELAKDVSINTIYFLRDLKVEK